MTVTVKLGRRLPRQFAKRLLVKGKGWLTLQETVWLYIVKAFSLAKKMSENRPEELVTITIENKTEFEDMRWQLEYKIITITSPIHEKEVEEYNEAMKLYSKFNLLKSLSGKMDTNDELKQPFNSKIISKEQFQKAKDAGLKTIGEEDIASKLLDLGIISVIEKDW